MIRRETADEFWLITQHDHALLAGEVARHVGNGRFRRPDRFDEVIQGISLHDSGWPLHDDEPTLNAMHLPLDVFETPREVGLQVWRASADRAQQANPYAGLLTSLHALSLSFYATGPSPFTNEKFDLSTPQAKFAINKFQHHEVQRQEALRAELGLRNDLPRKFGLSEAADPRERELVFHFRLLQAMDKISLALCCTNPPAATIEPVLPAPDESATAIAIQRHGNDVLLDPWPFAVAEIALTVPYRPVPRRTYADEREFREMYASAPAESFAAKLRARV